MKPNRDTSNKTSLEELYLNVQQNILKRTKEKNGLL